MRREALKLAHDALVAGRLVLQFAQNKSLEDYLGDTFLRSAIERQFFIVGEAIAQLEKVDGDAFASVPEARSIVGFRNLLAHGYASVDNSRVWALLNEELPKTIARLQELSDEWSRQP